jgi:hypothetical protein
MPSNKKKAPSSERDYGCRRPRDAHGRGHYREILRAFIAATSEGALVNWTEKL